MDIFSYTISSSSSSSNSSSTYPQQEQKKNKKLASYHSSLHGVRKLPTKPMTKLPIAPLPPTPPKIYRVEPNNFKDFVQMLTSSPEFQSVSNNSTSSSDTGSGSGSGCGSGSFNSRRLQDIAPPPLVLSPISLERSNDDNNNNNNNDIASQWREFLRPSSSSNIKQVVETCIDSTNNEEQERSHVTPRIPSENYFGSCSPLANFPLSPASFAWCSSILLSPGTLTSPNAVL
ncbi:putative uncharacterized protein DDB_G0281733 [Solanum pennellii]|uniref:VQ domain-containing protein n=1 Tax=Solanum pennellii TaxID=28526 RepID=A0ABM1HLN5_SOLPN|nr:putative uncharacterized protein DDB_G0281733 [Solanum pennellii]